MIKTFQCTDSSELDDIINFYLETDHFEIIDSSYKVLESDKKPLFTLGIKSKADVIVHMYDNGQIKWSYLICKDEAFIDGKFPDGWTFHYSPKMDCKVMLERGEGGLVFNGNYIEWYENSGKIFKWINYKNCEPILYKEWFDDSVPAHSNEANYIPVYKIHPYLEQQKWFGREQQIKIKGQFKNNTDTDELEKEGEWIKWNDKGEEILNVLYEDGKIKDVVDEFYYDSDPLPCHEDFHEYRQYCSDCDPNIKYFPQDIDYD